MDIPDDIPHAALPSLVNLAATGDEETFHTALRKVLMIRTARSPIRSWNAWTKCLPRQ